jgi:hypothetical protein
MAGVIAVWAAVFSCYALAFRAQSPLLALVPPLALVVFADSVLDDTIKPVYGVLFLVAALAVLFADSLRRIRAWGPVWSPIVGRDRLMPVAGRNARWVGASALVMAVLAPLLLPGFGTTSLLDISHWGGDHRISVSPLVQMGSVLTDPKNNVPFFSVQVMADGVAGHVRRQHMGGTARRRLRHAGTERSDPERARSGPERDPDLHHVERSRVQLARLGRKRTDADLDRARRRVARAILVTHDGRMAQRW